MKKKFSKILGVGLALMLVLSLMVMATPVSAAPPTVSIDDVAPDKGASPLEVTFTVTTGGGATPYTLDWDLDGDGAYDDAQDSGMGDVTADYTHTVIGANDVITVGVRVTDATPDTATDSINIGVDPKLIPTGDPDTAAKDVKGTEQKFVIFNLPESGGTSAQAFFVDGVPVDNPADVMEDAQFSDNATQVVAWEVIPGLNKSSVGNPGSGADIIVTAGGGPTYPLGVSGNPRQNWIKIWTRDPGDANVIAWLDEDLDVDSGTDGELWNDKDIQLIAEKKWGDIDHTILDLNPPVVDPITPIIPPGTPIVVDPVTKQIISGQEEWVGYIPGTSQYPEYEYVDDWVYAWFYKSPMPSTFIDSVGHAVVHWWLIVDDDDGVNQDAIDAIMADLGPDGVGTYADWPGAWGTPKSRIDAVWTGNESAMFTFSAVTEGTLWPDPNVDGTFNNDADMDGTIDSLETYIKTMTEDDLPGEQRGLVQVELKNIGTERLMIVTLTEYPWPYAGENTVAIEKGKKGPPPPPPFIEKLPNIVWAGEKEVVEWRLPLDTVGQTVLWYLEDPSVGTFEGTNPWFGLPILPGIAAIKDSAVSRVQPEGPSSDPYGAARVILHSDKQGKSNVIAVLLDVSWDDMAENSGTPNNYWPSFQIVGQQGFLIYFLAFEEVELVNMGDDLTNDEAWLNDGVVESELGVNHSSLLRFRVKGFFEDPVMKSPRPEKPQDIDGDGITDIILPAGRWILPDDYPTMAFGKLLWDLMDTPVDDIVSFLDENLNQQETLGSEPGEMGGGYGEGAGFEYVPEDALAMYPVIGPFSKLEPVNDEGTSWDVDQQPAVPADGYDIDGWNFGEDWRTTVVPDGLITPDDANMPPAEILFAVTSGSGILTPVNKANLYQRPETVMTVTGVVYTNPYYWQEIPANLIIPPQYGSGLAGYEWDSWGWVTDPTIDGPYRFWDGLTVWTADEISAMNIFGLSTVPTTFKTYTDNRGEAWVEFTQKHFEGSKIEAVATYPYLIGDHLPLVSNPVVKLSEDKKDIKLFVDDVMVDTTVDPIRKWLYLFVRNYDGTPAPNELVESTIDGPYGIFEALLVNTTTPGTNPDYDDAGFPMPDSGISLEGKYALNYTRNWLNDAERDYFVDAGVFVDADDADDYAISGLVVLSSHLEDVDVPIVIYDVWAGTIIPMFEDIMVTGFGDGGPPVFDPMVYDVDDSGVIEKDEALAAVADYFDLEITKAQALEVIALYFG